MRHLLCCLLLAPAVAGAEIYRWTDAQGQVHFSEKPQAVSTGAWVAIIIGMGLPLFIILFVMRNKQKNP